MKIISVEKIEHFVVETDEGIYKIHRKNVNGNKNDWEMNNKI